MPKVKPRPTPTLAQSMLMQAPCQRTYDLGLTPQVVCAKIYATA
jgi:hypothetical protein